MNRKVSMSLLMNHGLKNPNKQYVFLTPLDTVQLVANNGQMKIFRLIEMIVC